MAEYPHHKILRLENFTAFADAAFDFAPGVNAFVGENGTGKTHLLKAMYACQRPLSRDVPDLETTLLRLFQTEDIANVMRSPMPPGSLTSVSGVYGDSEWSYAIQRTSEETKVTSSVAGQMGRPVFLPAIDMMGHTRGFQEAYNSVFLDFDQTCYDVLNLFRLKSRGSNGREQNEVLTKLLGGEIVDDKSSGRFYLETASGRLEMPMIAEGLRKVASLVLVQKNNWLLPGATLYWDEPEVNLNPILMDEIVGAILAMSRAGVQVFLATHSYVILKELDLQAEQTDSIRYFGLQKNDSGTTVNATDDFALLNPNPILDQYNSLYDRELTRSTGRNQRGERVR